MRQGHSLRRWFRAARARTIRHFQCMLICELTIQVTAGTGVPVFADKLPRTERANH